jgi:hypothetical protein
MEKKKKRRNLKSDFFWPKRGNAMTMPQGWCATTTTVYDDERRQTTITPFLIPVQVLSRFYTL